MQSSEQGCERPQTTLGERRGNHDLVSVSLDFSWAKGLSEGARSAPYPSPPMSGSPPFTASKIPSFVDRGQDSFHSRYQDGPPGLPPYQVDSRGEGRVQSSGSQTHGSAPSSHPPDQHIQEQNTLQNYPPYQRYSESQQAQSLHQFPADHPAHSRPPVPTMGLYTAQHDSREHFPPSTYDRPSSGESSKPLSPRSQRKPKGHVAAACVPCKRAHLRCDNSRPCARCKSNAKEDACVDTQHKKRGRPRLRDERERYEGMGQAYPAATDPGSRRPLHMYGMPGGGEAPTHDALKSQGYRVLKSQGGAPQPPPQRYLDHASPNDTNAYSGTLQMQGGSIGPRETPCAYLTLDLLILRTNRAFEEAVGAFEVNGRRLFDIVTQSDHENLYRLQRALDEERQQREPHYLPPIYARAEQERLIQNIGITSEDVRNYQTNRQETLAFVGTGCLRSQPACQVRLGIQKFQSIFFVVLLIDIPLSSQIVSQHHHAAPYAPEPQQQQYSYSQSQPFTAPPQPSPYGQYQQPPYVDPRTRDTIYRPASAHLPAGNIPASGPPLQMVVPPQAQLYAPPFQSQGYGANTSRELPRSAPQTLSHKRQDELQLPPIRSATGLSPPIPREDRRLDIGGLLEDPSLRKER